MTSRRRRRLAKSRRNQNRPAPVALPFALPLDGDARMLAALALFALTLLMFIASRLA